MTITNKDIEKMKEVFATKEDLEKFATKEELSKFKDEVVDGLDKVMDELGKIREDQVFAKAKDVELERRLEKVEAKVGA